MTLQSRLPQIIKEFPDTVKEGMVDGLKPIARAIGAAAPDTTIDEPAEFHAEAIEGEVEAAIYSEDWYWFLAEYGTVKEPARPYVRPSVEAGRSELSLAIVERLKRL